MYDEELERLNNKAFSLFEDYDELNEFYIDDERAYKERKSYLDEKKEKLSHAFNSYYERLEQNTIFMEDLKKRDPEHYEKIIKKPIQ